MRLGLEERGKVERGQELEERGILILILVTISNTGQIGQYWSANFILASGPKVKEAGERGLR